VFKIHVSQTIFDTYNSKGKFNGQKFHSFVVIFNHHKHNV